MNATPCALPPGGSSAAWPTALVGLGLVVLAVVALTGPGRIDIVDGQSRYEVGRSLVDHGDLAVRNPEATFAVFPGRDGQLHTYYRFPQSAIAAGCVLVADATGPSGVEARRHFFFSLHGAVLAAGLAVTYAVWFRRRGLSPTAAVGWAAAGIFCTPSWYYSTSTFDDLLGAWVCVAALVVAYRAGTLGGLGRCAAAGLLVGLALNCKQPLGIFLLPAAVAADMPAVSPRVRLARLAVILAGVGVGAAAYIGYDWYKFPGDMKASHAELVKQYGPPYVSEPWRLPAAVVELIAGPASGMIWYAPAVLLGIFGAIGRARQGERRTVLAIAVAAAVVTGFVICLSFYKGDPAWGPRYLTPLFAVAWLYAPDGLPALGRRVAAVLLTAGCAVQVLGLSVDPQRLYIDRGLPPGFPIAYPMLHFRWELSHLLNRPREIVETWTDPRPPEYTPMGELTTATSVLLPTDPDPDRQAELRRDLVRRYQVYNGPRFWWINLGWLPSDQRPVDLATAGWVLGGTAAIGLGLLVSALRGGRKE